MAFMNTNKKTIVIIGIAVLILLSMGYYSFQEFFADKNEINTETKDRDQVDKVEIASNVGAEFVETTITSTSPLYLNPALKKPSLNRTIVVPDSYSAQTAKIMKEKIAGLIEALKKDPSSYVNWSDLAMRFKMVGDYRTAEEIWLYLSQAAPRVSDAFINLGDLYAYYFHDNVRAEPMFLKAVAVAPRSLESYNRLVDFYVTVLNDKTAAVKFLKDSVAKYPDMELTLQPLIAGLK